MQQLEHNQWTQSPNPQEKERSRITTQDLSEKIESIVAKATTGTHPHGPKVQSDSPINEKIDLDQNFSWIQEFQSLLDDRSP